MSELLDIVIGDEVAGPEGLAQGPASRIGVKSSDAPQGQPHTSPGQSEMASAMQRRPGSTAGAVFEALKGRHNHTRSCFALSGLRSTSSDVPWGVAALCPRLICDCPFGAKKSCVETNASREWNDSRQRP